MNTSQYALKPIVISAKYAHTHGIVSYKENGVVEFAYANQSRIRISPKNQYPTILATFLDLNKALSSLSTSPHVAGKSLRQRFDDAFTRYKSMLKTVQSKGGWEPDYGTYVYDRFEEKLYLIAPKVWYRLGLVTSNAKLLTDPKNSRSWQEIRTIFDQACIGFAGASVGGNIIEGAAREIRFKQAKVADPDWVEIMNLNRLERGSLAFLAKSRAKRRDLKNPFDLARVNKADFTAYQQNLVDPYAQWYVYSAGLNSDNMKQFIRGAGKAEPKIDMFVEEMDDMELKYSSRQLCRKYGVPVLMLSDFGHIVEVQFHDFSGNHKERLGFTTDSELKALLSVAMTSGNRTDRFNFIRGLCGPEFETDEFGLWVRGMGEQPTSSLPQSGATALTAGGLGGKLIAMYLLGYKIPRRFLLDLRHRTISE